MFNCGMCGRPTRNPQAICEFCIKAKERSQVREQRRDDRKVRESYSEWSKEAQEKEEDLSEVWADESIVDLKKKPKAK
ncbi:MAG: hypothetical protein FJY77_05020 [Candidatus Altiarchaeales archaeon]|nr:hypothetical protein [Candidatus Altiarchaeales archaeon]